MNRERPDVIHSHLPHASWLTRWSRLTMPSQMLSETVFPALVFIDTLHSSSTGGLIRRLGYRSSDWLADSVTAVSQSAADAHLAAGMVNQKKLSVVPNGVDVEDFMPDERTRTTVRQELGLNDEFLWLAAGRLEPVKDYPTLLRAFAIVPGHARLLIAGSGSEQNKLCRLTARLGLERRVRFLGFQPDIKRWMRAADGFVLSSLWEGLPVGLIEAGACALPSIATDVPGSREVIVRDRTGRLIPCAAPGDLARTMTSMMHASPHDRRVMGNLARLHVTQSFSLEAMLDRWEKHYRRLLARSYQPSQGVQSPIAV
jgi:glycosyltransferase involved in cell wall biosynthesis